MHCTLKVLIWLLYQILLIQARPPNNPVIIRCPSDPHNVCSTPAIINRFDLRCESNLDCTGTSVCCKHSCYNVNICERKLPWTNLGLSSIKYKKLECLEDYQCPELYYCGLSDLFDFKICQARYFSDKEVSLTSVFPSKSTSNIDDIDSESSSKAEKLQEENITETTNAKTTVKFVIPSKTTTNRIPLITDTEGSTDNISFEGSSDQENLKEEENISKTTSTITTVTSLIQSKTTTGRIPLITDTEGSTDDISFEGSSDTENLKEEENILKTKSTITTVTSVISSKTITVRIPLITDTEGSTDDISFEGSSDSENSEEENITETSSAITSVTSVTPSKTTKNRILLIIDTEKSTDDISFEGSSDTENLQEEKNITRTESTITTLQSVIPSKTSTDRIPLIINIPLIIDTEKSTDDISFEGSSDTENLLEEKNITKTKSTMTTVKSVTPSKITTDGIPLITDTERFTDNISFEGSADTENLKKEENISKTKSTITTVTSVIPSKTTTVRIPLITDTEGSTDDISFEGSSDTENLKEEEIISKTKSTITTVTSVIPSKTTTIRIPLITDTEGSTDDISFEGSSDTVNLKEEENISKTKSIITTVTSVIPSKTITVRIPLITDTEGSTDDISFEGSSDQENLKEEENILKTKSTITTVTSVIPSKTTTVRIPLITDTEGSTDDISFEGSSDTENLKIEENISKTKSTITTVTSVIPSKTTTVRIPLITDTEGSTDDISFEGSSDTENLKEEEIISKTKSTITTVTSVIPSKTTTIRIPLITDTEGSTDNISFEGSSDTENLKEEENISKTKSTITTVTSVIPSKTIMVRIPLITDTEGSTDDISFEGSSDTENLKEEENISKTKSTITTVTSVIPSKTTTVRIPLITDTEGSTDDISFEGSSDTENLKIEENISKTKSTITTVTSVIPSKTTTVKIPLITDTEGSTDNISFEGSSDTENLKEEENFSKTKNIITTVTSVFPSKTTTIRIPLITDTEGSTDDISFEGSSDTKNLKEEENISKTKSTITTVTSVIPSKTTTVRIPLITDTERSTDGISFEGSSDTENLKEEENISKTKSTITTVTSVIPSKTTTVRIPLITDTEGSTDDISFAGSSDTENLKEEENISKTKSTITTVTSVIPSKTTTVKIPIITDTEGSTDDISFEGSSDTENLKEEENISKTKKTITTVTSVIPSKTTTVRIPLITDTEGSTNDFSFEGSSDTEN